MPIFGDGLPAYREPNMGRFTALDSWRGICACLVAVSHFQLNSHAYYWPLIRNAYLFVDFFFLLSGFVIAANYQRRLLDGFGVGKFMLLRFGRLYPLHLAMLLAFVAIEFVMWLSPILSAMAREPAFTGVNAPGTIFSEMFLVHGLGVLVDTKWNGPSWSISTEFFAYLIFAVALLLTRKYLRYLLWGTVVLSPVILAVFSKGNMDATHEYALLRCVYGFAAGVITFNFYERWHETVRRRLDGFRWATLAEVFAILSVGIFVVVADKGVLSVAAPYLFAVTVFIFAFEAGRASRVLLFRPLVLVGALSYSIYMVHTFLYARIVNIAVAIEKYTGIQLTAVSAVETGERRLGAELWQGDIYYLVILLAVIAVSYVTFNVIEQPGRRWIRKLADDPKILLGLFAHSHRAPVVRRGR